MARGGFFERQVEFGIVCVRKIGYIGRTREVVGLPDRIHAPLREERLELVTRGLVEGAVLVTPERHAE
jgi:hypothetical protein